LDQKCNGKCQAKKGDKEFDKKVEAREKILGITNKGIKGI
jgi:hypothetical protein